MTDPPTSRPADRLIDRGPCPICGSSDKHVHIDFRDIPVMKCDSCGFIHSGRVLPDDAMAQYYERSFGSRRHMEGQIVNATVNILALPRVLDMSKVKTFLDVGTGYGFLLPRLRDRYGVSCTGMEISKQEAEYARNTLRLNVVSRMIQESGLPEGAFDVAGCFEVIEHIADPVPFVRHMARHVKPGGHVLLMTDNFESAVAKRSGPRFTKWIPHSHVSDFAPATIERCMLEAGGLEVTGRCSFTPWELIAQSWKHRLKGRADARDCFDLEQTLSTEMGGRLPMFHFRLALNRYWFRMTSRNDLNGQLMFVAARKLK
ncbi:MAG: methyltransferase domain-containing protein [Phycisphaerales bacterium]|nr:methyltransferase domain-containing protein [Phycisphaerales bacterium]